MLEGAGTELPADLRSRRHQRSWRNSASRSPEFESLHAASTQVISAARRAGVSEIQP
jgi:hypothetical protein